MTLEYKILWIDDEPESVESKRAQVKEYLEDVKGFDCKIIPVKSYKKYIEEYSKNSNINDFDLLIVDFKLDNPDDPDDKHSGFDIIQNIRSGRKIFTEIIFYSSKYDNLITTIKSPENYIEGVFTSPRDELQDKVQEIIDVIIKKVQDVNNLRGLIMAEVAELDIMKENILTKYSTKNKCGTIESYLIKKLNQSYDDNLKKVQKYTTSSLNDIFENLYIDSDKRARAIKKVENSFDEDSYRKNILYTRNKFAHIKEIPGNDENGQCCKVIGDIPFTEEKCIKIRKEIKKYKKILEDIEKAI